MQIREAVLLLENSKARIQHQWVDYEKISNTLKQAIIAAEDAHFLQHEGFDWEGIENALEKNRKKGRLVAGGSTISQQLAKNLFLSPGKSWFRKGEEAVITLMIEALWSKERVFEAYLNSAEWGKGVFGAEAAAKHYFGVSAEKLNPMQAATLAVMLPNPRFYDGRRQSPYLQKRAAIILQRMQAAEIP